MCINVQFQLPPYPPVEREVNFLIVLVQLSGGVITLIPSFQLLLQKQRRKRNRSRKNYHQQVRSIFPRCLRTFNR